MLFNCVHHSIFVHECQLGTDGIKHWRSYKSQMPCFVYINHQTLRSISLLTCPRLLAKSVSNAYRMSPTVLQLYGTSTVKMFLLPESCPPLSTRSWSERVIHGPIRNDLCGDVADKQLQRHNRKNRSSSVFLSPTVPEPCALTRSPACANRERRAPYFKPICEVMLLVQFT